MQVKDMGKNRKTYGLLALICLFLQLGIVPYIGLGNGRANMALVFAAIVAMRSGGATGVMYGFAAGLIFDLSTTGPIGLMALLLTVGTYLIGTEERNLLGEGLGASVLAFAGLATGVSLAYHIAMMLVGEASGLLDVVVFRTIPTTLLTIAAFVPFAMFYGQTTLKPLHIGGGSKRTGRSRGSHYDLGNI